MTDYSKTINLPKTNFSMKANLSENENKWIQFWKDKKVYENLKKQNAKSLKSLFYTMVLLTRTETCILDML